MNSSTVRNLISVASFAFTASFVSAASITLDFEGIGDQTPVGGFYNGGGGGNLGIEFSSNGLAVVDEDAGGTGNFGGEPSPDTILFFLDGTSATLNYAAGFDTGFSFFYTAINNPGVIDVYEGVNRGGNILASINLPLTPRDGALDPTGAFSPLVPMGVNFTGVARSVDFGGTINQIGFDNITFGSATPAGNVIPSGPSTSVPDGGSSAIMLFSALGALSAFSRRLKS